MAACIHPYACIHARYSITHAIYAAQILSGISLFPVWENLGQTNYGFDIFRLRNRPKTKC